MSEKTEKPTPKKSRDARENGQVPVSRDLAQLVIFAGVGEVALLTEKYWHQHILALANKSLAHIANPSSSMLTDALVANGSFLLAIFMVVGLLSIVLAVAGNWGQFGILISPKLLKMDLNKLNPINGVSQLFSKKKLLEAFSTILKTVVFGLAVYLVIRSQLGAIVSLSGGVPDNVHDAVMAAMGFLFHVIAGIGLVLALIDFAIQKIIHNQSLMMSMEDIKREYRESEGDPVVKGQRRQLARELAQESEADKTEEANAVVVNPTHFAVAMLYDVEKAPVPIVLAKGRDETAQAMIHRARECGIPVIRHVWLARTLYATGHAERAIPKSSYEAVAHVYAVIQAVGDTDHLGQPIELESHGIEPDSDSY